MLIEPWKDSGGAKGGNYGYMDQSSAIKFIHDNAENLGGDRNRITIFGVSAGGESVSSQTMHAETSQLISGAIVQSGQGLWNWNRIQNTPRINDQLKEFCNNLDCCEFSNNMEDLVDNLRKCDVWELMDSWWDVEDANDWYAISKDGVFFQEDVIGTGFTDRSGIIFIDRCPLNSGKEQLKNGYSPYTGPIIFGSTSFDGSTIFGGGKAQRRHDLKPEEIEDFIFPLIEENESIEPVPAWARKFIVQVRDSLFVRR